MGIKRKKNKKISILKFGFWLMIFSIAILLIILGLNYFKNINTNKDEKMGDETKLQEKSTEVSEEKDQLWTPYVNMKYLIAFSYPYLLHERDFEEMGDYEFFVVFEENKFSKEKGVAFGVSRDGMEKEIARIKKDISKQGKSRLIKDEKLDVDNGEAWVLEFEPEEGLLEKRAFLIIEEGDYTYSFSTIPEQMKRLSESIQFLD